MTKRCEEKKKEEKREKGIVEIRKENSGKERRMEEIRSWGKYGRRRKRKRREGEEMRGWRGD